MASHNEPILTALHYLFSHSGNRVVAHCLDLDIVASGADLAAAERRLNGAVLAQIALCFTAGNYSQLRFKAPSEYWIALSTAKELDRLNLEVEVPPVVLPVSRSVIACLPVFRAERMAEMVA